MQKTFFIICLSLLTGCTTPGFFEFNAITGGYYSQFKNKKSNVYFGDYRIRNSTSRFLSPNEQYEKGPLPNAEINAWWQVQFEDDSKRFFYARSFPNHGIQAKKRYFWSDWQYFAYIGFGPILINQNALTEQLKPYASHIRTAPSGLKYYAVGKETSFYYFVNEERVRPNATPLPWIEVPGIEITQHQFEILHERCDGPWQKVRCFMDLNFPNLTEEQKHYIRTHEHEDDAYNLSERAKPPKIKKKVNPWL